MCALSDIEYVAVITTDKMLQKSGCHGNVLALIIYIQE